MSLPADVTRCHDAGCSERHECRRWLEKKTGVSHARSLFPYDISLRERCPHRIAPEDVASRTDTLHKRLSDGERYRAALEAIRLRCEASESVDSAGLRWLVDEALR